MKKFFVPLLLAMLMLLPMAISEAADVPDFRTVAGNHVTDDERVASKKGYNLYSYECDPDLKENFAERYVNLLLKNYPFHLVDHHTNEYPLSQYYIETWIFRYDGSKKISAFKMSNKGKDYYCHLELNKYRHIDEETKSFAIRIANGLTYAGN